MELKEKLDKKLKFEGRTKKWFVAKYCGGMRYNTAFLQINGDNGMSELVMNAINQYLKEK